MDIVVGVAGDRYSAPFGSMFELPVTASRRYQVPTVCLDHPNHLTDLQVALTLSTRVSQTVPMQACKVRRPGSLMSTARSTTFGARASR